MIDRLFVALWFILAGYLFFLAIKENRLYFTGAVFFAFLGGWTLADQLTAVDLMSGVYGWIYRGVAMLMLAVCGVWYYWYKKKG